MNEANLAGLDSSAASAHSPPSLRVLVDLSHAADGYVGIAQDLRLIFSLLADLPGVATSGLLMPTGRHDLPRIGPNVDDAAALVAGAIYWMGQNWQSRRYASVMRRLRPLLEARKAWRQDHALLKSDLPDHSNAIWRVLFEKTLGADRRASIMAHDYYATDLSVMRIIDRTMMLPFLPPKRLHARGFDAVFFCMPRPVRLPRGVRQIVRFHDAVPITDSDTIESWRSAMAHQRLVRKCVPDAIFVCNSPQSAKDVVLLDPRREKHVRVIPCALAPAPRVSPALRFERIVSRRRTFRLAGRGGVDTPPPSRYIVSVSTLEPRKNFEGLVRAWERVVENGNPELGLVIVAGKGWREDRAKAAMAPHVASGRLVHLEGLPPDELAVVNRGAACFVFPSFNEGFGYAPLEAYQAGTPCIVSDLPVFRWVFGNGALYVDPYNVDSIADAIERLATAPTREVTANALKASRADVVGRFTMQTVREQWAALCDDIAAERGGRTASARTRA